MAPTFWGFWTLHGISLHDLYSRRPRENFLHKSNLWTAIFLWRRLARSLAALHLVSPWHPRSRHHHSALALLIVYVQPRRLRVM